LQTDEEKVLNLAEQFIAAMPARFKNESEPMETADSLMSSSMMMPPPPPSCMEDMNSVSDDLGVESMCGDGDFDLLDFGSSVDFNHTFDDTLFSYRDSASLSPASCSSYFGCGSGLGGQSCSPAASSSFVEADESEVTLQNGGSSPPGTAADLQEFLQASLKCERDLSNLTLSDQEQRELYEAAQIIQKAYRSYKGRKRGANGASGCGLGTSGAGTSGAGTEGGEGQKREAKAAVVIQNYYRRYKQVRFVAL
jgi:hypothetical protein